MEVALQKKKSPGNTNMTSNGSSSRQQQRLLNFNSTRTAWVLSVLLILSLSTQIALIVYHDDFVLQLKMLEGELREDINTLNSIANDAVNSAYEYNEDGDREGEGTKSLTGDKDTHNAHPLSDNGKYRSRFDDYSMEPLDILKRAGVDHTLGFVPSITGREARAAQKSNEVSNLRQRAVLPPLEDIVSTSTQIECNPTTLFFHNSHSLICCH